MVEHSTSKSTQLRSSLLILNQMPHTINFHFRRVEVHDTTPALFKSFLRFVYSGKLDDSDMDSSDSLSELLLLSDRYEMDSLKELCEGELVDRVDYESALTLLSISDHFNASKLKVINEFRFLKELKLSNRKCWLFFRRAASSSSFRTRSSSTRRRSRNCLRNCRTS